MDFLSRHSLLRPRARWRPAVPAALLAVCACALSAYGVDVRLRDISHIQGLRDNQLIGYGLVVGLQGTGDSRNSLVTSRSLANLLEKFGLDTTQRDFTTKNSAAVMVTATLTAFVRPGDRIDTAIASLGDAKSLQGGTLLLTPLRAGNQQIYAVAQGPVAVGGYYVGQSIQQIQKNVTTSGTISNGAIVEKAVEATFLTDNKFVFKLERTDFILADQVVKRLEEKYGAGTAKSVNGTDVEVTLPESFRDQPVAFIAEAQSLTVPQDAAADVVIDERTGTVVVGGDVRISKVAISHGGLHIAIAGDVKVSQPQPFSQGHTVMAEALDIRADEAKGNLMVLPEGTSIEELVRALNTLGTLPRDTIVILENMKAAGALHGRLITR
jgi:flagellar P-ring protein FlgI